MDVVAIGNAHCVGGHPESPDLSDFPLLCWAPDHEKHGNQVFTNDGAASVADVATEFAVNPNLEAIATKLGTTERHVGQAIAYAATCGTLKGA